MKTNEVHLLGWYRWETYCGTHFEPELGVGPLATTYKIEEVTCEACKVARDAEVEDEYGV